MVLFENDAVFLLKTRKEDALRNYFRVRHFTSHSKYSWIFMTDHVVIINVTGMGRIYKWMLFFYSTIELVLTPKLTEDVQFSVMNLSLKNNQHTLSALDISPTTWDSLPHPSVRHPCKIIRMC